MLYSAVVTHREDILDNTDSSTPKRVGLLFREKPLVAAILFPKLSEAVREILYSEILREDAMHREAFGIKEVGH